MNATGADRFGHPGVELDEELDRFRRPRDAEVALKPIRDRELFGQLVALGLARLDVAHPLEREHPSSVAGRMVRDTGQRPGMDHERIRMHDEARPFRVLAARSRNLRLDLLPIAEAKHAEVSYGAKELVDVLGPVGIGARDGSDESESIFQATVDWSFAAHTGTDGRAQRYLPHLAVQDVDLVEQRRPFEHLENASRGEQRVRLGAP